MIPWEESSAYLRQAYSLGVEERRVRLDDSAEGKANLLCAIWHQVAALADLRASAYEKSMATTLSEPARWEIYERCYERFPEDAPPGQSLIAGIHADGAMEEAIAKLLMKHSWFEAAAEKVAGCLGAWPRPDQSRSVEALVATLMQEDTYGELRQAARAALQEHRKEEWLAKPGLSQRKLDIVRHLLTLPPAERVLATAIADHLISIRHCGINEEVVRKDMKELKSYGISNQKKVGYYAAPDTRELLAMLVREG